MTRQAMERSIKPVMACPELSAPAILSPETLALSFNAAPVCTLGQSWLRSVQPDFAPGQVRLGRLGENLLVFAELADADIFTRASRPNQRLWEMGDAFEIFLRPSAQEAYVELQIAPNNQRLQLRYAGAEHAEAVNECGGIESCLLPDGIFESRAWIRAEQKKWFVYARIPARVVLDELMALADTQWFFSFGRYDYTRGRQHPVISSTSPHAEPDFHRPHEWGVLAFEPAPSESVSQIPAGL